jgi:sec-independent protein translocase protein TatC
MSMAGVVDLLRGKPRHPIGADGRMALSDHLRELRARIIKATLFLVVAFLVALFFYGDLLDIVAKPYHQGVEMLNGKVDSKLTVNGITGGLLLQMKLCGVAAVIASSPYWLYQIWAFILPGLHPQEKRWSRVFAAVAGPLFLGGVALGYYIMPKTMQVLINFTPSGSQNLVDFATAFTFITRMLLVFGLAMEIPLFVVMLNLAGVLSGKAIGRARPWIVIGTFIFAAVATPSTDPFSMLMLAVPMLVLFGLSEVISRSIDRMRGRRASGTDQWADDQVSPL